MEQQKRCTLQVLEKIFCYRNNRKCYKIDALSIELHDTLPQGCWNFKAEYLQSIFSRIRAGKQPNIIFNMADDHGSKAISAYGNGLNHTPNIDRLAHEGMKLNHCYVTNSICTPIRAAILTGTYNHVNCVTSLNTPINNQLPNVAKHLQNNGYQTAIVGKWHLGKGRDHEPSGFDYWSILPGQGDYFDPHLLKWARKWKFAVMQQK